jgi:hypothetical protein
MEEEQAAQEGSLYPASSRGDGNIGQENGLIYF